MSPLQGLCCGGRDTQGVAARRCSPLALGYPITAFQASRHEGRTSNVERSTLNVQRRVGARLRLNAECRMSNDEAKSRAGRPQDRSKTKRGRLRERLGERVRGGRERAGACSSVPKLEVGHQGGGGRGGDGRRCRPYRACVVGAAIPRASRLAGARRLPWAILLRPFRPPDMEGERPTSNVQRSTSNVGWGVRLRLNAECPCGRDEGRGSRGEWKRRQEERGEDAAT